MSDHMYKCCEHCADDQPHIEKDTHIVPCELCQDTRIIIAKMQAWRDGYYAGKGDYAASVTSGVSIRTPNPYEEALRHERAD